MHMLHEPFHHGRHEMSNAVTTITSLWQFFRTCKEFPHVSLPLIFYRHASAGSGQAGILTGQDVAGGLNCAVAPCRMHLLSFKSYDSAFQPGPSVSDTPF
jgi:hypothetical protein